MKKAEAISILATSVRPREAKDRARYDEAVRMAIEALKRSETPNSSDCISRQAAIDCVTYDVEHTIECLKALPSAQQEQTNCEYCHEDTEGYVKPIEKNGHAFVRFGMDGWELCLNAKGWHGSAKIMYCPMCGRRLER